jgi:hypothetical protein
MIFVVLGVVVIWILDVTSGVVRTVAVAVKVLVSLLLVRSMSRSNLRHKTQIRCIPGGRCHGY